VAACVRDLTATTSRRSARCVQVDCGFGAAGVALGTCAPDVLAPSTDLVLKRALSPAFAPMSLGVLSVSARVRRMLAEPLVASVSLRARLESPQVHLDANVVMAALALQSALGLVRDAVLTARTARALELAGDPTLQRRAPAAIAPTATDSATDAVDWAVHRSLWKCDLLLSLSLLHLY
jgi:hypothetical protein